MMCKLPQEKVRCRDAGDALLQKEQDAEPYKSWKLNATVTLDVQHSG